MATTPFTSSVTAIATAAGGGTTHLTDHNNIKSVLTAYDNYISSPSGIFSRIQIAAADGNITGADATSQSASAVFSTSPIINSPSISTLKVYGNSLLTVPPLQITSSSNVLTTPAVGALEFDSKALSFTTNTTASSRGPIAVNLFTSNTGSTAITATITTLQSIFPSTNQSITVAANTTYEMEMWFNLYTSGATSNSLALAFGVSAPLTSIGYMVHASQNGTSAATPTAANSLWVATAASTVVTPAIATLSYRSVFVKGLVRTNASGTFIPQLGYSTAPTGTASVLPNAYIKLVPLTSDTTLSSTAWHA